MQMAAANEPTRGKSTTQVPETPRSSSDEFASIVDSIVQKTGLIRTHAWKQASEENPDLYAKVQLELAQRKAERDEQERQQRAAERKKAISDSWCKTAGRFANSRIENFGEHGTTEERAAQRRVVAALLDRDLLSMVQAGQNLLFIGPPGGGKDHLMFALAWKLLHSLDGKVVSRNGAVLRQQFKSASFDTPDKEAALLRSLIDARLLLLSAPVPTGGKELSDFQSDGLYHVVDQRWTARRPIWATLNLPIEKTREAAINSLTAPVWDRLKDDAVIVLCNWESHRVHAEIIK